MDDFSEILGEGDVVGRLMESERKQTTLPISLGEILNWLEKNQEIATGDDLKNSSKLAALHDLNSVAKASIKAIGRILDKDPDLVKSAYSKELFFPVLVRSEKKWLVKAKETSDLVNPGWSLSLRPAQNPDRFKVRQELETFFELVNEINVRVKIYQSEIFPASMKKFTNPKGHFVESGMMSESIYEALKSLPELSEDSISDWKDVLISVACEKSVRGLEFEAFADKVIKRVRQNRDKGGDTRRRQRLDIEFPENETSAISWKNHSAKVEERERLVRQLNRPESRKETKRAWKEIVEKELRSFALK